MAAMLMTGRNGQDTAKSEEHFSSAIKMEQTSISRRDVHETVDVSTQESLSLHGRARDTRHERSGPEQTRRGDGALRV